VPLTLTEDRLTNFRLGINWDELPRTFQDAIQVCRALRIRYLWIDSLCIMQDSWLDWRIESARMAEYYGHCFVCLAATQGSDSTAVLSPPGYVSSLKEIEGTKSGGTPFKLLASEYVDNFFHDDDDLISGELNSHRWPRPLATRAWAYQERVLSPRVAYFGSSEVLFECRNGSVCECQRSMAMDSSSARNAVLINTGFVVKDDKLPVLTTKRNKISNDWDTYSGFGGAWWSIVSEYSRLNITAASDRLPALSGLAYAYRASLEAMDTPPGRYLAGLWERSILDDLAWRAVGPISSTRDPTKMPSWSWACINGPVRYSDETFRNRRLCKALSAGARGADAMSMINITSCHIALNGRLWPVNWLIHRSTQRIRLSSSEITTPGTPAPTQISSDLRNSLHIEEDEQTTLLDYDVAAPGIWQVPRERILFLLALREIGSRNRLECLLLDHVDGRTYQRIGFTWFFRSRLRAKLLSAHFEEIRIV
jgi:hypothetical protein